MSGELAVRGFSYDDLKSKSSVEELQSKAVIIKARAKLTRESMIQTGLLLMECKEIVGHGNFLGWLKYEFGWGERTAHNFMSVARQFTIDQLEGSSLEPTTLVLLAAKSTPEAARRAILDRAANGTVVTVYEVKEVIAEHRGTKGGKPRKSRPAVAALPAVVVPEQRRPAEIRQNKAADTKAGQLLGRIHQLNEDLGGCIQDGEFFATLCNSERTNIRDLRTKAVAAMSVLGQALEIADSVAESTNLDGGLN